MASGLGRSILDAGKKGAPGPARRGESSRVFLDALPDMMFRLDGEGRYLDFKPARDLQPFVPPEQFLGRTIGEVLPAGVARAAMAHVERALETGETQTYAYHLDMPDGEHAYEARIVPLGRNDVLAIVRDVTAQPPASAASKAVANDYGLTARELAVLRLVTIGMTDKEVAHRLEISVMTARNHTASIRRKMDAVSRTEASVKAIREGIV